MNLGFISLAALLFAAPFMLGASQIFTVTGTTAGGPVDAQATFSLLGTNQLQVTVQDLLPNPTDVGQLIGDLQFQIPGVTGTSLGGSSAQQITVHIAFAGGGTGVPGATASTGWALGSFNGGLILCVVCPFFTSAAPAQTIIGPGLGGGSSVTYAAANGSIAGNVAHNPFLDQTATFTISGTGITSSSAVTGVLVSFGTQFGVNVAGVQTGGTGTIGGAAVPEPGSFLLGGTGLALALLLHKTRLRCGGGVVG